MTLGEGKGRADGSPSDFPTFSCSPYSRAFTPSRFVMPRLSQEQSSDEKGEGFLEMVWKCKNNKTFTKLTRRIDLEKKTPLNFPLAKNINHIPYTKKRLQLLFVDDFCANYLLQLCIPLTKPIHVILSLATSNSIIDKHFVTYSQLDGLGYYLAPIVYFHCTGSKCAYMWFTEYFVFTCICLYMMNDIKGDSFYCFICLYWPGIILKILVTVFKGTPNIFLSLWSFRVKVFFNYVCRSETTLAIWGKFSLAQAFVLTTCKTIWSLVLSHFVLVFRLYGDLWRQTNAQRVVMP